MERRANVANTAFGKLVGTKPDGEKSPKPVKLRMAGGQPVKATTLGTQVSNGLQKPDRLRAPGQAHGAATQASTSVAFPSNCLFCDGSHPLEKCFKFRNKSFKNRKDFVLNKRLCMKCLRENTLQDNADDRERACLVAAQGDTILFSIHLRPKLRPQIELMTVMLSFLHIRSRVMHPGPEKRVSVLQSVPVVPALVLELFQLKSVVAMVLQKLKPMRSWIMAQTLHFA